MARVANPFQAQTPIGAAIAGLGDAIFGGMQSPSELQKQQLENQLLRARTTNLQTDTQKNQAILDSQTKIGSLIGQGIEARRAAVAPVTSPGFVGPVRPENRARQEAAFAADSQAGRLAQAGAGLTGSPQDLANLFRFMTANTPTATDNQVARALAGAGQKLGVNDAVSLPGQAAIAQRNSDAQVREDAAKIANTPQSLSQVRGAAAQATIDAEQPGGAPVTPDQRLIGMGAQGFGSPLSRVADPNSPSGITLVPRADAANQPGVAPAASKKSDVTGLTTTMRTQLQQSEIAMGDLQDNFAITRKIATENPHVFGITGTARRVGQGVQMQIDDAAQVLGLASFDDVAADGLAAGIDPQNFDPALTDIQKLGTLLAYQAASALGQQSGRGLSDQDFKHFRNIVGDPTQMLSSQEAFLSGLDRLEQVSQNMMRRRHDIFQKSIQGTAAPAAGPALEGVGDAQDAQDAGEVLHFDAQGNLQ